MFPQELYTWTTSYYNEGERKWKYGNLHILPNRLVFEESSNSHGENMKIVINFDTITELKKASSLMLFKCVIVFVKEAQHWFSSLPNRDVAYTVIMHFWKDRLIGNKDSRSKGPVTHSKLGKELLEIAQHSQKMLEKTGKTLLKQGEQLEHAMGTMFEMHADLDVAENLTTKLESWCGKWGMSFTSQSTDEAMLFVDPKGLPVIHEFPVLYFKGAHQKSSKHQCNMQTKECSGYLRISREGITVMDNAQKPLHHYNPRDVSGMAVISPWQITVTKYKLGQPDVSFGITSTHMVEILEILQPVYTSKMELNTSPVDSRPVYLQQDSDSSLATSVSKMGLNSPSDRHELLQSSHPLSSEATGTTSQAHFGESSAQLQKEAESYIQEDEVNELTDMIERMKAMALGIQSEQSRQLDTIDKLTSTVDQANIRLEVNTKRIKKLT